MEQWRLPGAPVDNPTIGPRTRFFDDLVIDAVDDGTRQVVLVAAGMDSRAFRLALPEDATVFELDQGSVLDEKEARLTGAGAVSRCRRVTVAVDLTARSASAALSGTGFEPSGRSAFVAEGLSYYLSEEENGALLDDLSVLAADGSRLGMDMLSRRCLQNEAVAPFLKWLKSKGVPWKFGTDDPGAFLANHGWTASVHDFDTVARRLGRWPPPGVSEEVAARAAAASRSFFISARRARAVLSHTVAGASSRW